VATEEAFQAALDHDPTDSVTRMVFADWLLERDDPRAYGYWALGALRRSPLLMKDDPAEGGRDIWWQWNRETIITPMKEGVNILPHEWIEAIIEIGQPGNRCACATRRIADDIAAAAWVEIHELIRRTIIEGAGIASSLASAAD
jgi:uncharacterized protein (TIGR02996 family)